MKDANVEGALNPRVDAAAGKCPVVIGCVIADAPDRTAARQFVNVVRM